MSDDDGGGTPGVHIDHGELSGIGALSSVLAAVADGVLVLDFDGLVVLANRVATRMFQLDTSELIGQEFGFPVPVGDTAEIDLLVPGGNRSVEMRASITEIDGRPYRVATFRDITERIRSDRQLRDAIRMREELLAAAAHELKTPVTVITGMSVSLRDAWDDIDDATRRLLMGRVADRAEELQELLLEVMSRRAEEHWASEPAVQLARGLIRRAIEPWPELDVRVDVPADLEVWADGGQVVEIVANLVDNARKYGRQPITITVVSAPPWVEVRVEDSGAGVPREYQSSMFESGWRGAEAVRSSAPGSGLGLSIVRKLARANDGNVWYESGDDGAGACFVVQLPATPGAR